MASGDLQTEGRGKLVLDGFQSSGVGRVLRYQAVCQGGSAEELTL